MNVRSEAYKIIVKVLKNNSFSDSLLVKMTKKLHENNESSDFFYQLVKGVIKMRDNLEYIISAYTDADKFAKTQIQVKALLYIGFYQLLYMDKVPDHAAVNETVEAAKKQFSPKIADFINAVMRSYLRNPEISYPEKVNERIAKEYSFPVHIVDVFLDYWGEEDAEMLCMYFNEVPKLCMRVNQLATTREKFIGYFARKNIIVTESEASKNMAFTKQAKEVLNDVAFSEGYFTIQDISAALVVELSALEKNMSVLDLFAGPGGKVTFAGELMRNTGEIIAVDKFPKKVKEIKKSCQRLKIENMSFVAQDFMMYGPVAPAYDRVMLDVPCTGWGVFQKKAELRWQKSQDLDSILKIQSEALQHGAKFVKPGGCLIYSTCTLNKQENEKQVENFLESNKNFELLEAADFIPEKYTSGSYLKTIPHIHNMDGAFAAKMRKTD
ncbi:MAG: 16S rRNA methyltransferase [Candidatus Cloacimonadota bacterium]|nr:MAG: 16S rRNA methyltransferase [Candidatus Cloacimonadota bacterium]